MTRRRSKWIIDGARTTARELARVAGRGGSAGLALRASRPARGGRVEEPEPQWQEDPPPEPPSEPEPAPPSPSEPAPPSPPSTPSEPAPASSPDEVDDAELTRIRDELASELDRLASRDDRD